MNGDTARFFRHAHKGQRVHRAVAASVQSAVDIQFSPGIRGVYLYLHSGQCLVHQLLLTRGRLGAVFISNEILITVRFIIVFLMGELYTRVGSAHRRERARLHRQRAIADRLQVRF